MRKLRIIFLIVSVIMYKKGNCQQEGKPFANNTFYVALTSKGHFYSIHYDRIFTRGNTFTKSAGAGFSISKDIIAFPLGIHFFTTHNKHHALFSLTVTPYIEKYKLLFTSGNSSDKKLYFFPSVGYRYQKQTRGFFVTAAIGPVIDLDPASNNFWQMNTKVYTGGSIAAGISF